MKLRYSMLLLGMVLLGLLSGGCTREAKKARHLQRANTYFDAEQYDKAEVEYMTVLKLARSMDPTAVERLARICYAQGRVGQAFALLARARQLNTNSVEVRLKFGSLLRALGKHQEAQEEALFVLRNAPANEEALLLLVDAATTPKELEVVRQRVQLAQQGGDKAVVHLVLGVLRLRDQEIQAAEAELKQAQALDPKSSAVAVALAGLYWGQTNLAAADQAFKKAAELAPPRSTRHLMYADFKIRTGAREEARKILEEVSRKAPDYLPAWKAQADLAIAESKFEDCEKLIAKILVRDPANYDALLLHSHVNFLQKKPAAAIQDLTQLTTLYPRAPRVHYELGVAHLANNDPVKAIPALQQAVRLNTNNVEAILLLARQHLRMNDPAPAISLLTPLSRRRPPLIEAHLLLAKALVARKTPDEALAVYRELATLAPKASQAPFEMGLLLRDLNRPGDARKAFEKALELSPGHPLIIEQLVDLDIAERQYQAAFQRIQLMQERSPKTVAPLMLKARVFQAEGKLAEAESVLQEVLALQPEARNALLMRAQLLVAAKKAPQALETLNAMLAKNPKDAQALLFLASLQDQLANYAAAAASYEKLLAISPKLGEALNNLAFLYVEHLGQPEKAYDLARKARELLPNDPNAGDTLGWVLYRRGDYARAMTLLQDCAEKLPGSAEIAYHLGMASYMMGEEETAKAALSRALQSKTAFADREEAGKRLALLSTEAKGAGPGNLKAIENRLAEAPNDPIALLRLATIHEESGAFDKARSAYEKLLQANPKAVRVMSKLALLCADHLQDSKRALELAKDAHALAPEDAQISHTLGRLAFLSGDHKWAAGLLKESAQKLPDQAEILFDLALAQYSVGQIPEAEATLKSALQANLKFSRTEAAQRMLELIGIASNPAQADQAAARVQELLKASPDDVPALAAAAVIYGRRGNWANAKQAWERVLALYPLFSPATKELAILYARDAADQKKAHDFALKARQLFPQDSEVAKVLGVVSYRQGDFSRATQLLKEAAKQRPEDGEVFFYLGMAHSRTKESRLSRDALGRALALNVKPELAEEARRTLTAMK